MTVALRSQYSAAVTGNRPLCREHFELELALDEFPSTEPGQFIQIACREMSQDDGAQAEVEWTDGRMPHVCGRELSSPLAMLRRPFSLAGRRDDADGVKLLIIHRVVGIGTGWMAALNRGDAVSIIGPLGNKFVLPAGDRSAVLVGGGVGIPPMLYLAEALGMKRTKAVAICGVTTRDLLPLKLTAPPSEAGLPQLCIAEFSEHGIASIITTDDGSLGRRGFVTAALGSYLDEAGENPIIYTCGPEPMMKRVADIANQRGLECQVAVERAMACGMGTCQSCCIKVRASGRADGRNWIYRLACTDGPIFHGSDLLW